MLKRCNKCGALLKVLKDCNCDNCGIACCGETLENIKPNSVDASFEKHVPEYKIAATDDKPKQIAIGIFNINNTKNVINKTALIIILPPYSF